MQIPLGLKLLITYFPVVIGIVISANIRSKKHKIVTVLIKVLYLNVASTQASVCLSLKKIYVEFNLKDVIFFLLHNQSNLSPWT